MFNAQKGKNKMPKEHKELVQKIHALLQERGYSFWDAQMVTNLVLAAAKVEDPIKALDTAAAISEMMKEAKVDRVYAEVILQILAMKINEQVNKTSMSNIQLAEI